MAEKQNSEWNSQKSSALYGIPRWGGGFFSVNDEGEVEVCPSGKEGEPSLSMLKIVSGLKERGMVMPVLLRFEDILAARIRQINESFRDAFLENEYNGDFRGVYPIKVNQQQQVLEEVSIFGATYHHGLEAGSKPELVAAMSYLRDPEALLVCNGYKDEEFIELGLYARKLGIKCIFVIETQSELPIIIRLSKRMKVKPILGVRMKLSSKASGYWQDSGGDRSVFGLNTAQVVDVVHKLKDADMLDCLKLLHYHLGSQIPNIRDVRISVLEASRVYAGLVQEGAPLEMLDLGGGLAIDYDGSNSAYTSSCNYTLREYCSDVVEVVKSVMDESGIKHPTIVTESGRATVAYYSVLLFNVLDATSFEIPELPEMNIENPHDNTKNIYEVAQNLSEKRLQEDHHDAIYYRDEIRELFKYGNVSIRERAFVEEVYWYTMTQVVQISETMDNVPGEINELKSAMADIYYGNISVFQSLPDTWAIDQLFPIMPIHRLKDKPEREAVLADITCDCDGKIDRFIDSQDVRSTLPVHRVTDDEPYYLGAFLVGAYQETLGDLHNLLGDTNVVSIRIGEDGEPVFTRELEGDSVADVLSYVEFEPREVLNRFRDKAEKAVHEKRVSVYERREIMEAYKRGLYGYTYYES